MGKQKGSDDGTTSFSLEPRPNQAIEHIHDVLMDNVKSSLLTISSGSLLGNIAFLIFIRKVNCKKWLTLSFVMLTAFLFTTGITLKLEFGTPGRAATVALYSTCHFLFNLGGIPQPSKRV
jgi:hypothetical protein